MKCTWRTWTGSTASVLTKRSTRSTRPKSTETTNRAIYHATASAPAAATGNLEKSFTRVYQFCGVNINYSLSGFLLEMKKSLFQEIQNIFADFYHRFSSFSTNDLELLRWNICMKPVLGELNVISGRKMQIQIIICFIFLKVLRKAFCWPIRPFVDIRIFVVAFQASENATKTLIDCIAEDSRSRTKLGIVRTSSHQIFHML